MKCRSGCLGAGGQIRNSNGCPVAGFALNLGACSVLAAEFWGLQITSQIWENLKLFKRVLIEIWSTLEDTKVFNFISNNQDVA